MINLPTQPVINQRKGFPWRCTWLVGSPPKVGKSKFCEGLWKTTGKPVLHIDLENSTEDLSGYIVGPEDSSYPIRSLAALRGLLTHLRTVGCSYSALVVDTVNVINEWCEEETCQELGLPYMGGKLPSGKAMSQGGDWAGARAKVLELVDSLRMLQRLLILVAHTKVEKGEFSGVNIAVPPGLATALRGRAQVIAYIYVLEGAPGELRRWINFAPSDNTISGSRYSELNNQVLPLVLRDKDKDGKGWVSWQPIFHLFDDHSYDSPHKEGSSGNDAKG